MKQTFLIRLEDTHGSVVTFERWTYKKATTCINKTLEMYRTYFPLYERLLSQAAVITCYATPDPGTQRPVWSATVAEFLRLIATGEAVRL